MYTHSIIIIIMYMYMYNAAISICRQQFCTTELAVLYMYLHDRDEVVCEQSNVVLQPLVAGNVLPLLFRLVPASVSDVP